MVNLKDIVMISQGAKTTKNEDGERQFAFVVKQELGRNLWVYGWSSKSYPKGTELKVSELVADWGDEYLCKKGKYAGKMIRSLQIITVKFVD